MAGKRKRQAKLRFEPTGGQGPFDSQFSPAKVRYSGSSQIRSSPSLPKTVPSRPVSSKKSQNTIQESLGKMKPALKSSQASPSSKKSAQVSFMPRSQRVMVGMESSDDEAADVGNVQHEDDSDDDDVLPGSTLPPPFSSSQSVSTRLKHTIISDDDDDDDDLPLVPSSARRRRAPVIDLDSDTQSDVSPAKKRKVVHKSSGSSSSPSQNTPARRLIRKGLPSSSPTKPKRHQGHRTEKQKNMELLRRRRAGEKLDKLTSSESESGDDKKGLYDTDSDDALQALDEFPDDEEDDDEVHEDKDQPKTSRKSKKPVLVRKDKDSGSDNESDLDDFVVEDEDGPIGVPLDIGIPIEFTAQARKPLKEQFPYVIEWLVHNKINPAFDRKNDVYIHAWRKLDDEVRGLASSKFISSVWKVEFHRSLKARPKLEAYETGKIDSDLYSSCEACGRSGHPATWEIVFQGRPYHEDNLDEIESDSEGSDDSDDSDDSDGSEASGHASLDAGGNSLPPVTKKWSVGSTCCSNAETAHSLMHWKVHLKEWVELRLEQDGHMKAAKLEKREKMKPKKRRKAANEIVDGWRGAGVVDALYNDFKAVLHEARNKSTSRGGQRWK